MRKRLACGIVLGLALAAFVGLGRRERTEAAEEGATMLAHNVFFSLKDNSAESKKKLVDACKKYLTKHPGEVFFAAGILAQDLDRPARAVDLERPVPQVDQPILGDPPA